MENRVIIAVQLEMNELLFGEGLIDAVIYESTKAELRRRLTLQTPDGIIYTDNKIAY